MSGRNAKPRMIRELINNVEFRNAINLSGDGDEDYKFMDEHYSDEDILEMHDEAFMELDN